jgi:hypothetical protein
MMVAMVIVIVILVVVLDCYDEIMVKWSKKVVVVVVAAVTMVVVGGYGGELLYNDIIKCGYINDKMMIVVVFDENYKLIVLDNKNNSFMMLKYSLSN